MVSLKRLMKLRNLDDILDMMLCFFVCTIGQFFFSDLVTDLSGYLAGKNVNVSEFDGPVLRDFEGFYAAPVLQCDSFHLK